MNLHRSEISRRWAAILARLKETRHIIALSVFLILSMWYLFGAVNITIPTVISLLYIFKYQQAFRLRDVLRISLRMTVLCGAAIVCWVNLPLCILGNLAVPLGLVYSLSDRFTPKAYYIYVLGSQRLSGGEKVGEAIGHSLEEKEKQVIDFSISCGQEPGIPGGVDHVAHMGAEGGQCLG